VLARVGVLGGEEEAGAIGTSLSAIAIVAEKKEGKDVKNPKSTKGKQPCVAHVPQHVTSHPRTKTLT